MSCMRRVAVTLALVSALSMGAGCATRRPPSGPAAEPADTAATQDPGQRPQPIRPVAQAERPAPEPALAPPDAEGDPAQARVDGTGGQPDGAALPPAPASGPLTDGRSVFATLQAQMHTRHCSDDRVARRWIGHYARAPQRLSANLARVMPLLAHVVEAVDAAGLPGEFALLPIVESWYRPAARNGGTAGLWQFSSGTARAHGLRVDAGRDERLAPRAATRAAMSYLAALQARFGDWRLAVMAFNAGEYRLQRALSGTGEEPSPGAHRPAGLATITYEHLGKLLALACVVREPGRIGLVLPEGRFAPLPPDPPAARPPAGDRAGDYQVRRGDSLWLIARRHGLRLAQLLEWNGLRADAVLQPGQRLRVRP